MANSTHQGMNTYDRILQHARTEGEPIGPQHHLFNQQRKRWEARQKNLGQLAQARETKKVKGELRQAKVAMSKAREKIAAKTAEINEAERLREKYHQLQIAKIADGYKSTNDGQHIKSRGNGL